MKKRKPQAPTATHRSMAGAATDSPRHNPLSPRPFQFLELACAFRPLLIPLHPLQFPDSPIPRFSVVMAAMAATVVAPGLRATGFASRQLAKASIGKRSAADQVARKAMEVRAGTASLSELEKTVKQAIRAASQSNLMKQASFLAFNALMVMPALAEEVEKEPKGKIFDFNLTLPIIAVQFLLLMVALDNIWFKPVAKVMDSRDENIRAKLMGVRDNSGEIKKMQNEAEAILKAARIETTEALSKTKRETAAMLDEKLQESRARIEKELALSLANLEEQKEDTLRSLDKQVQTLSEEILSKVIPFKV